MSSESYELDDGAFEERTEASALRQTMQHIANGLDDVFNGAKRGADRKMSFFLLAFPVNGEPGQAATISNVAYRHEILALLKAQVERLERLPNPTALAQVQDASDG